MALTLDGSARGSSGSSSFISFNLTTTLSNDVIVVIIQANGGPVFSVATSPALFFTQRASSSPGGGFTLDEWWSACPSPNTFNITVQQTSTAFLCADAFAVNGAIDINNPYDGAPVANPSSYVSITTSRPNCFIFGGVRDLNPSVTSGAGWTQIQGGSLSLCTEYKVVSTPQSGLAVTFAGGGTNGAIADAITSDPFASNYTAGQAGGPGIVQSVRMVGT